MATVIGFDETKKRVTCQSCAAIIEYVEREIQEKIVYDSPGDSDVIRFITCPNCMADVKVGR